jgi:hypothetical protein
MNSYSYIESLFKAILEQSKTIQGRFYILPKSGGEINTDEFDQVMAMANGKQKFPVAAMMPPRSSGVFTGNDEWEEFTFVLFFLNTTYYTGSNQGSKINPSTQTSSHRLISDWDEMKVAATDFIRIVDNIQRGNNSTSAVLLNSVFRMAGRKFIDPISFSSTHRLSGVKLEFKASIFQGCDIQDYIEGGMVVLPESDNGTFDVDLLVVRNEVLNIVNELGLSGGGLSSSAIVYNEVPAGAINNSNATFLTAFDFIPGKILVYINGLKQEPVTHFQTSGTKTIMFSDSPLVGEKISVDYIKQII